MTPNLHTQQSSNLNNQMMSTHDKSVDGSISSTRKLSLFPCYPEAAHLPDQAQCKQVNSELMKKIVMEKRKNNIKFKDGNCMNDIFRFYPVRPDLTISNQQLRSSGPVQNYNSQNSQKKV